MSNYLSAMLAAFIFLAIPLHNEDRTVGTYVTENFTKSKLEGTWDYKVRDVSPEYSTGTLRIMKTKKVYTVEVDLPGGTVPGSDVVAKKNRITFNLLIENQRVDVVLVVDGDTISGESTSPDGVYKLEGTRRNI